MPWGWCEKRMDMVWHDYGCMERVAHAIEMKKRILDNPPYSQIPKNTFTVSGIKPSLEGSLETLNVFLEVIL